jgi:multimeric flavodoxin WrbA
MKKILGFSSGGVGREGNVDRMVKAVLEGSGQNTQFVKLSELAYSGCKGCVARCARPQRCMLEDDLLPWYEAIREADALVIGTPVYFDGINGLCYSFLERFFGYRHVTVPIAGKPVVLIVNGAMTLDGAELQLRRMLGEFFQVKIQDVIRFQTEVPPCLRCGRHSACRIGGLYMMLGEGALDLKIKPEMFKRWENDPAIVAAVEAVAQRLREV